MEQQFVVGLDIGASKLAAGLVDQQGALLELEQTATLAHEGGQAVLKRALALVERVIDAARQPASLGIAAAGQIDSRRGVVAAATELLPGWAGTPLRRAFRQRFGLPCVLDNDVNAHALAELRFAGLPYRDLLYVAAGTGLGGGVLRQGRIVRGAHHCAGEIGHSTFLARGLPCECGSRGCLEQYCASGAILRFYQAATGRESSIAQLASLANAGDEQAAAAFARAGAELGAGLAGLARVLDPQAIVLGGGLVAASPLYVERARSGFAAAAWPLQAQTPVLATRLGTYAGVLGAAALALTWRDAKSI